MAKPFTGVEMANIILKGTPQKMQELYYMNNEFPTRTKPLIEKLEALEPIVKDFASRKKEVPGDKTQSPNTSTFSTKTPKPQNPKTPRVEK